MIAFSISANFSKLRQPSHNNPTSTTAHSAPGFEPSTDQFTTAGNNGKAQEELPRAPGQEEGWLASSRPSSFVCATTNRSPATACQGDPLPTVFTCLFCNHENSVTVKIDKKAGVGSLECKVCGQRFQCTVNCTLKNPEDQTRSDPIPYART